MESASHESRLDLIQNLISLKKTLDDQALLSDPRDQLLDVCRQLEDITGTLRRATSIDAAKEQDGKESIEAAAELTSLQKTPLDIFGTNSSILQPKSGTVKLCWQSFSVNIDPLIKVLHSPTTEAIVKKGIYKSHVLHSGELVVLFGVYLAAISSMPSDTVQASFGLSKRSAIRTYKGALEHAILRANIVATDDLVTLQGFVLSLSLDRFSEDSRRAWALSELVERLTSSLSTQTTALQQELRKRLIYELWYMEYRAYADLGHVSNPPCLKALPYAPTNIDDADLSPDSIGKPLSQLGWTDMSFALIQADVARTAVRIDNMALPERKEAEIDACENRIRSLYLSYCDGTRSIHWLAQHVAYVLVMELRFKTYCHPSLWAMPYNENRKSLFFAAIDILDTSRRVAMEPEAAQWTWLLEAYMQFWPLRFALQELCHSCRPKTLDLSSGIVERALKRWEGSKISKENYEICQRLWKRAKVVMQANRSRDVTWDTGIREGNMLGGQELVSNDTFTHTFGGHLASTDSEIVMTDSLFGSNVDGDFVEAQTVDDGQHQFELPEFTDLYGLGDLGAIYP